MTESRKQPDAYRTGCNEDEAGGQGGLSPRERQTLSHLLKGASVKEVAGTLRLSKYTVCVYVKEIYRHYDVHSRAELMARLMNVR